ncbi:DUF6249 domain-containing protein [Tenacibaculum caenipelagi]|uniref:DUF6249 domain-containing protein n=1 Tax=Tenacibaculum caenipelagi TaxID=1325435 RepID=A0A4R6TK68_9FLAO|nr:DUF6249 domain-containing protein [Tenacibaculum caenipelagi]TDQ29867.1 hypothetical protein DFQ07_0191 [Tenacibaculum caenipelagi]
MEAAIVFMFLFAVIFGIFYLFYSTRNKERLALIEKGVDAKIFMQGEKKRSTLTGRVIILNLALLAMGIGVGVLLGALLSSLFGYSGPWETRPTDAIDSEVFFIASIFLCAGGALLIGFNQTKKLDNE